MHRDGYGFLIADRPIEGIAGDIFIPPESAEKGDAWRPRSGADRTDRSGRPLGRRDRQSPQARASHGGGRVSHRQEGQFVVPQDGRIQQWIEIPEGMEFPAQVR
jgi:ribonuclease R